MGGKGRGPNPAMGGGGGAGKRDEPFGASPSSLEVWKENTRSQIVYSNILKLKRYSLFRRCTDKWYKCLAVALVCKSSSRLRIVRTWRGGKEIKEAKPEPNLSLSLARFCARLAPVRLKSGSPTSFLVVKRNGPKDGIGRLFDGHGLLKFARVINWIWFIDTWESKGFYTVLTF